MLGALILGAVGAITTLSGGVSILKGWFSSTPGRNAQEIAKLESLAAGTTLESFKKTLGEPTFVNPGEPKPELTEYLFVLRKTYVQVIADASQTVLAFSVTTREKSFNPQIDVNAFSVRLGQTKFTDLDQADIGEPDRVAYSLGARRFFYAEEYYLANPGNYQTVIFSINDAGPMEFTLHDDPLGEVGAKLSFRDDRIQAVHRTGIINTYTLTAPGVNGADLGLDEDYGAILGADLDQVRVLSNSHEGF